ncbi:MAG: hypothetical protein HGA66_16810 [Holophaga sp.]|nr:hypothetical protein [Holophaga sp.]
MSENGLEGFGSTALGMLVLKVLDPDRYYRNKETLQVRRRQAALLAYNATLRMPVPPEGNHPCFKHSGNAGDIIYALPAIRALCGGGGGRLRLVLDTPIHVRHLRSSHPLGGVMLNRAMFDLLAPLLEAQPYLESVQVLDSERVDYDLDRFRTSPLPQDRLGISRWYFYHLAVSADLSEPWLEAPEVPAFRGSVIIARSQRYRNLCLDYQFLDRYPDLVFCGLEEEFADMRRTLPRLTYAPVKDFLQLAGMIRSCRLFIGNQSLPYALAEAQKVRRVLELDPSTPNVVPCGRDAHDVVFQSQFQQVVARMLEHD